jgi:hypothetical protein
MLPSLESDDPVAPTFAASTPAPPRGTILGMPAAGGSGGLERLDELSGMHAFEGSSGARSFAAALESQVAASGMSSDDPALAAAMGMSPMSGMSGMSGMSSMGMSSGGSAYSAPPSGSGLRRLASPSGQMSAVLPDSTVGSLPTLDGSGLGGSMPGLGSFDAGDSMPGVAVPAGEEAEYRAVFQDYLDTRQRCGEPTDGVTYEKFVQKLQANREQLVQRYACKRVKFQVYVKDGRAALKATPLAD